MNINSLPNQAESYIQFMVRDVWRQQSLTKTAQQSPSSNIKRHIVIVIDTLSGGGAEVVMLRLASTLNTMGHDVALIVINPIISHQMPENINITFVNPAGTKRGIKYFYYRRTAKALQKMLDELSKNQPIHAVLSNLPETDRITRHLKRFPVFHCIHSSFYQSQVKNKKSPFKRWLKKKRLQNLYNDKHLIFVSAGAQADLEQNVGVKSASSHVIYNPFPINTIQFLADQHSVQYQDYFIHVGRFNAVKRHDKLLKIYAESGVANPLLLMGEGSNKQVDDINNLIRKHGLTDRVIVTGFKQNPFPYIRNALALLLTSEFEGLSNVIIEALICGTPAVSFDCPSGPKEILKGDLHEFLIPFDNAEAFAAKIQELSQMPRRVSPESAQINRFEATLIAKQYIQATLIE